MTTINIHEAKTHLSRYAKRVKAGETIIICDRNVPFAELRPIPAASKSAGKRRLGQLHDQCPVGPDFFTADEAITETFEARLAS